MNSAVPRRTLLKGAAVAVVGWSAAGGTWVTAAHADEARRGDHPVPRLEGGTLETAPATTERFAGDFGVLVTGAAPYAVLRTRSVRDVATMVTFARRNRLTIAMNGQSGTGSDIESHSSYGQAQVPGGIAVDPKGFSGIAIDRSSAVVGAGVTWAQLADAALARGLTPAALTDYLHLSVGGTISVGGIGGTVQRYGLQCDTVQSIDIVTGTGEVVTASRSRNRDLFEAALAGGGQVGLIVSATVRLVPAPARALVTNLFYDDLPTYLADQERILAERRFSHQEGEIVRRPDDSGWRYKIEAVTYYAAGQTPDQGRLLAGLRDNRADLQVADQTYRDWIFRLDGFEVFLKEGGFWAQPKPWLSLVLPASRTREFITSVVAELVPADLGVGFAGFYPFPRSTLTRPLFATPAEDTLYLFDLLRFPTPGDPGIARMLEQNRRLYDRGVALGAKRYLVGAIPGMNRGQWQRHFGPEWNRLVEAKRRYDPQSVLTPGQGFFR